MTSPTVTSPTVPPLAVPPLAVPPLAVPPLAERQAALVAALVAGAEVPAGFDAARVAAARRALLRKRAGEVARAWPLMAAGFGADWPAAFIVWADGRSPAGSLRDGWDFARERAAGAGLPPLAAEELAGYEATWRYDGQHPPHRRRRSWLPASIMGKSGLVDLLAPVLRTARRRTP